MPRGRQKRSESEQKWLELKLSLFGLPKVYLHFKTSILNLQELAKREVVNVTHLVIPAELGGLLQAVAGIAIVNSCSCGYYPETTTVENMDSVSSLKSKAFQRQNGLPPPPSHFSHLVSDSNSYSFPSADICTFLFYPRN